MGNEGTEKRSLSADHRLTAAVSLPEVKTGFQKLCVDLSRVIRFDGGALSIGHVINACVVELMEGMEWGEQVAFVERGVRRLEEKLASAEPGPGPAGPSVRVTEIPAKKLPAVRGK